MDAELLATQASRIVKSDYVLSFFIAAPVHLRMSAFVAQSAVLLCSFPLWSVGSLYSGAFDALSEGFVVSGHSLQRVFAAECDSRKRDVHLRLSASHLHS